MHYDTRVTRAGLLPASRGEPFLSGPTFASPYHAAGDPSQVPHTYGRVHNPTWSQFEQALSELECGSALVFVSGMAAVTAVFGTVLRPDDIVVLPSDRYYSASLPKAILLKWGCRYVWHPQGGNGSVCGAGTTVLLPGQWKSGWRIGRWQRSVLDWTTNVTTRMQLQNILWREPKSSALTVRA